MCDHRIFAFAVSGSVSIRSSSVPVVGPVSVSAPISVSAPVPGFTPVCVSPPVSNDSISVSDSASFAVSSVSSVSGRASASAPPFPAFFPLCTSTSTLLFGLPRCRSRPATALGFRFFSFLAAFLFRALASTAGFALAPGFFVRLVLFQTLASTVAFRVLAATVASAVAGGFLVRPLGALASTAASVRVSFVLFRALASTAVFIALDFAPGSAGTLPFFADASTPCHDQSIEKLVQPVCKPNSAGALHSCSCPFWLLVATLEEIRL